MNIFHQDKHPSSKGYNAKYIDITDKWSVKRQEIRDKILFINTTIQLESMSKSSEDIGNPKLLCEELYKLRTEYDNISSQEREEKEKLIQKYQRERCRYFGKNPYRKYI